ncbi:MAG TPA: hypothetical protein ENJ54_01000 [Chloroflexi bacterium]|nr:hypothetical protein [Chloroflexota bacterium]
MSNRQCACTFSTWLRRQIHRDDIIGDFAQDTFSTSDRPRGNAGYKVWRNFVLVKSGSIYSPGFEALDAAWAAYQRECCSPNR